MLAKAVTSAAVWRISPHGGVPVTVISESACERAKYHPVIIYRTRMRSSDNINTGGVSCPLVSQRLNVLVTVPDGNHDGFINWRHLKEKAVTENRNHFPRMGMRVRRTRTNLSSKTNPNRSGCNDHQNIKNTGGAVVAMVKQPLHCA